MRKSLETSSSLEGASPEALANFQQLIDLIAERLRNGCCPFCGSLIEDKVMMVSSIAMPCGHLIGNDEASMDTQITGLIELHFASSGSLSSQ